MHMAIVIHTMTIILGMGPDGIGACGMEIMMAGTAAIGEATIGTIGMTADIMVDMADTAAIMAAAATTTDAIRPFLVDSSDSLSGIGTFLRGK